MAQLPELMTADEVAEALRIDPETARRWAREGRIPSVPMPGRALRFRREEIEAIMRGEQPTEPASTSAGAA